MGWNGDISKMGKLAENVGKLAHVPSKAAAKVADALKVLVQHQFLEGQDPYGKEWKPLAPATVERKQSEAILIDSGSMFRSLDVRPMQGSGVSITIDSPAQIHQTGWDGAQGKGPARPILPTKAFPETWRNAIDAVVLGQIQETLA